MFLKLGIGFEIKVVSYIWSRNIFIYHIILLDVSYTIFALQYGFLVYIIRYNNPYGHDIV